MNKFGKRGIAAPWDAIKALWCSGEKSTREIGEMFGVVPNTIETRASREHWRDLRDQVIGDKHPRAARAEKARLLEMASKIQADSTVDSSLGGEKIALQVATDKEIVANATQIAGSTQFRHRVIAANETALKVLEQSPPQNVGECDRFAEALTKVERIGARTYGYDRETDQPIINIGVLSGSGEYSLD